MKSARIGVIGDFHPDYTSHPETNAAIKAAASRLAIDVSYAWVPTEAIAAAGPGMLDEFGGIWVAPGAPYCSLEGALVGIRQVRKSGRPLVGT